MSNVYFGYEEHIKTNPFIDSLVSRESRIKDFQFPVRELGGTAVLWATFHVEKVIIAETSNPFDVDDTTQDPHSSVYIATGAGHIGENVDRAATLTIHSKPSLDTPSIELEIAEPEDIH